MPGTMLSRGNVLYESLIGISFTPASVNATSSSTQTITVPGAQVSDYCEVSAPTTQTAGIFVVNAWVSAANTVSVQFYNVTGGSLTPAAGIYVVNMLRPETAVLPGAF